ncbi:MAG: hypothetical protein ABJB16_09775 [Saprospiraceae bacterium]
MASNLRLIRITKLSNLALQLYSWFINNGHARNEKDEREVEEYFQLQMSDDLKKGSRFYEKLYLYQCYGWYAFIRQDFLSYYRYTQHWVDLFHQEPMMIKIASLYFGAGDFNNSIDYLNKIIPGKVNLRYDQPRRHKDAKKNFGPV